MKSKILLFLPLLFTILSCSDDENSHCDVSVPFSDRQFCFEQYDGNQIPFKIVDIDAQNYSMINSMCMTMYNDGCRWKTEIDNTQVVNGVSTRQTITREGIFYRHPNKSGVIYIHNENGDTGDFNISNDVARGRYQVTLIDHNSGDIAVGFIPF